MWTQSDRSAPKPTRMQIAQKGTTMANEMITSDRTIELWRPKPLARLTDGYGLSLKAAQVPGRRHGWRFDYSFEMKRKTLSLGTYPFVNLALAREKAHEARRLLANGIDPSADRQKHKKAFREKMEAERRLLAGEPPKDSFEDVARRWHATRSPDWVEAQSRRVLRRLEIHVFPRIGRMPIASVEPPNLLEMCRHIQKQGTLETAHRALEHSSNVFRFGIAESLLKQDPCRDLRGALQKPVAKHFAAITKPRELAGLLRALSTYSGTPVVRAALQLAPMLFLRPGELRNARWEEFDLDNAMWFIPSVRMKRTKVNKLNGDPHFVALPRQAVAILEELFKLTCHTGFVFAAMGRRGRCMSNATVNTAMRKLGYASEVVTGHGFRATARTLLHEVLRVDKDIIELQLAHEVQDANGRAYNRTEFLEARREMMQKWADYLDDLREGRADYRRHAVLPEFVPVTNRLAVPPPPSE